jgi:VWFA-related protein
MAMARTIASLVLLAAVATEAWRGDARDRVPGQGQDRPTFRAGVELVQVDVVVVDRTGRHVAGLKASDFTILDRGKPQTVATLDEVSRHHPETPPAPPLLASVKLDVSNNQSAQSDRLVVMVIDDLHIYKERTDRAKEIARRVLADLGDASSMAVLFTSQDHSTQVTTDQSRLHAAIDTLKGRQSWRRPHQARDTQTGAAIGPEDSMQSALAKVQQSQETNVQDFFDNLTQYKTLQDAARMLGAGDTRRKAFVLLSEGIGKDLSGIFGAMASRLEAPAGGAEYASGNMEGLTRTSKTPYHDDALIAMMEAMRRANIATYAIDPRGKVESKDLAHECMPPPSIPDPCSNDMADWYSVVRLAQHGLEMTAAASGGFAVTNTDDFTSGIKRIVDDLDHYYLLGFYPSDTKGKGYRPLDVRVAGHPEWTLRFRHGYMPGGAAAPPKHADPLVTLSAGILPKTNLPLRLTAIPIPGSGPLTRVVLALEVSAPRQGLQEADGKVRDTLKYEVLVVDEKKARVRSVTGLEGRLTLSAVRASDPAPPEVSYQVMDAIDLAPGHYEIRVSAVSAKLAKGGSVYLDVDVPDFRGAPAVLGGLAIGYADGGRVPVAPKAGPPALPFAPSLARAFAPDDTLRVYFEASVRAGGGLTIPAVDVLDATRRVVRSPSPSFVSGEPLRVDASIPLSGLPPGPYVLRATVGEGASKATRETGFVIQ